ncbi:diguanylate cyclase domain-containing protein [Thiomicrorhabdus chilensis]|uniref:diguanylate cyclase domain-containing protein n=1 Tax=Thiomicrorhabdus chilensis TaxID=63656 RepID=UPI0003F7DBAE|nr:diguanylate cyclase [Thiomicrorhabdus chilensis]
METIGYKIDKNLAKTQNSELFLATHSSYAGSLVCKKTKAAYSSNLSSENLNQEYQLLQRFDHPAIIKAHGLESIQGQNILVREYFEGIPLEHFLQQNPCPLEKFFVLAIQLTDAVDSMHQQGVLHGNLSSSCILVKPSGTQIMLTGFGAASRRFHLEAEESWSVPQAVQPYRAPEQSDRLNQRIGLSADLYSLGVIFFQMLSGRLPFVSKDAASLLHSHIAKTAPELVEFVANIPPAVSHIVSKLLEKMPGDRYSSASSLKADLTRCFKAFKKEGHIADFSPDGMGGFSPRGFSDQLYGREYELERLVKALHEQLHRGHASMVAVSGASGVGKSSLVTSALDEFGDDGGYRIIAKFDQYRQNTPFEMLYAALRDLIRQVVADEEEALQFWKKRLQDALGDQAGIVVEALPELQWVLGGQPNIEALPPSDEKARFNALLCRLVQAFATPERPFVLVLDDLQWADDSTLEWLEIALQDISHLLVIGIYRDNEVDSSHALSQLLQKISALGIGVENIELAEISQDAVRQLVLDYLPIPEVDRVCEIIFEKTRGNAFFVTEYLKQLHKDGVLVYNADESRWECDLQHMSRLPVSDNVVEFLSQRIVRFPENVRSLLKIASCIGNRFDCRTVREIYTDVANRENFEDSLQIALTEGWIKPEMSGPQEPPSHYLFTHDRIQQAVWSLFSSSERQKVHELIGRYLLDAHTNPEKEALFECVYHLNEACAQLTKPHERQTLAELNHQASQEAKASGDFELALRYIQNTMEWMPDLSGHPQAALIFRNRAECEHLCNRADQAITFYNQALALSDDVLEKTRIYELIIKFYTDISEFNQAYEVGRSAMRLLDVSLPASFNPAWFAKDFLALQVKLRRLDITALLDLPEVEDEHIRMAIRLLSSILKAAYQIKPELCVAISLKVVALCLKHGNSREAVIGYVVFGIIFQGGVLGKHNIGYEYGQLSMALLERYGNTLQKAEAQFVFGYFAMSWQKAAAVTEQNWYGAYHHGLEVGDWFHTGCAAAGIVQSLFMRGKSFDAILKEIERFQTSLKRIGAEEQLGAIVGVKQAIQNLRGETPSHLSFSSADFDEADYVDSLEGYGSRHFAHYYYVNKMLTLYLHRQYEPALEASRQSQMYLADSKGMLHSAEHYFLTALIQAKLAPLGHIKRHHFRLVIQGTIKRFRLWAEACPENFLVRLRILEGERYRIAKAYPQAIRCYDSAIEAAGIFGQMNMQAIASTLAADVYQELDQAKASTLYRQEANRCFQRWGATKVQTGAQDNTGIETSVFDVSALKKATEIIASEKKLPELLERLIGIMIENAGAQHGLLLLQENGKLLVQAEASVQTDSVKVMQRTPYLEHEDMVHSIVNYVLRSGEAIVLGDAQQSPLFGRDEEVRRRHVKSALCAPLNLHGQVKGAIYLENNVVSEVFTLERIELLKHLSGHIAIAIDNAVIYEQLEQKVVDRTHAIDIKNEALKSQNIELRKQNDTILELNSLVVKENEERKKVEKQLQQAIEKLNHLATTDGLTGLYNRRYFDEFIQRELVRQARSQSSLSLILCDIDGFKAYNDHYGHPQGDACLKQVTGVLTACVMRSTDLVARYGGEEFVIVLPDTCEQEALKIAASIHQHLQRLQLPHAQSPVAEHVTLSIGLAVSSASQEVDPEKLIKAADDALYRAKQQGRNQTVTAQT